MMHIEVSERIERPAHEVFRFVATDHFQNHPKWDPSILEMTQTSEGPTGVGTTCRVLRKQGAGMLEVTAFEPNRTMATRSRIGPFDLRMHCVLEPLGEAQTRLRLQSEVETHGPMRLVAPLMKPIFRKTMVRSLVKIKAMVEAVPRVAMS